MKYVLIILSYIFCSSLFCQTNDTLHVHIFGEFKNKDVYQLKYNRQVVCSFGGNKKMISVDIPIDTNRLEPFGFMPMDIYKLNRFRNLYVLCYMNFLYYPGYNHIMIYYLPYFSDEFLVYCLPFFKHVHVLDSYNKM